MAKQSNIQYRRRKQKTSDQLRDMQLTTIPHAEDILANTLMMYHLSALETLVSDFGFNQDQVLRFQDLCKARFDIKRAELRK